MRNNDDRRQRGHGRDFDNDYERAGRDSENWGANRQHAGGYGGRGRSEDQSRDRYPDRWGSHGRPQGSGSEYGDSYGNERFGPRSSGYGGYDGGQAGFDQGGYGQGGGYGVGRFPEDSPQYSRQQQPSGGGRQGSYNDRFVDDYGSRQRGEQYGHGEDRYSQGFYGDASRFGSGMQQGERESQGHHDPDYQQWRTEQLRNLDNDYEAWRGERYKKFSDEFNTWRSNRPSQGSSQSTQQGSATNKAKDKDQS